MEIDRDGLKYAPIYRTWYNLAQAKDTPAKKAAFYEGILDYAFKGKVPPSPNEMKEPHGTDYARYDGYVVAQVSLDGVLPRIIAGAKGGRNGKGASKARFGDNNGRRRPVDGDTGGDGGDDAPVVPVIRGFSPEKDEPRKGACVKSRKHACDSSRKGACVNDASMLRNKKEKEKEKENINHCITIADSPNGTGNENENQMAVLIPKGTGSKTMAAKFAQAVREDEGAFFDPAHDVVSICVALVNDLRSNRRWRQLARLKGEAAVREECFAFYRELQAGEEPKSRGAALNARLANLPDIAPSPKTAQKRPQGREGPKPDKLPA